MDERARRIGENEALYREVNERVLDLNARLGVEDEWMEVVCECGDGSCIERLRLTIRDYEQVRASGRRFVLVPGHEAPDVERIVERHDGFFVVEKDQGDPARVAEDADPR